MKDWLGNDLRVGDPVLYSSKSYHTGMNLGELLFIDDNKIQIRIWYVTRGYRAEGKIVTLQNHTGAYKSVTRYFGNIPVKDN